MTRKINPHLWLLLSLVLIAAMLNFLVASQRVTLIFFFLPTLYSAYHFGRRHAIVTAFGSVALVIGLTFLNPAIFGRRFDFPFESRWFDITAWGGVLVVAAYTMGTLYDRYRKSVSELREGYDGVLAVLHHLLTTEKYGEADSFRVSLCAAKIAEQLGLDAKSTEDVRTAALLRNINKIGIDNDMLYRAANISKEELSKGGMDKKDAATVEAVGGSLRRVIPIMVAGQQLAKTGGDPVDAPLEVQILAIAEAYESMIHRPDGHELSPDQAEQAIVKASGKKYDSMVVDAFVKAFGSKSVGAGA